MAFFNRKLYRQKPKQWGPPSQVQSSIFANAERAGIDPGSIALCMPFWEKAGSRIQNYTGPTNGAALGVTEWKADHLDVAGAPDEILMGDHDLYTFDDQLTIFAQFFYTTNSTRNAVVSKYNTADNGREYALYINDNNVSGQYALFLGNEAGSSFSYSRTDAYVMRYKEISLCGTWKKGEAARIFLDGAELDYVREDVKSDGFNNSAVNLSIGGSYDSDRYLDGGYYFTLMSRQALTPSQIAYLSDNPYFLLHPRPSVFYSVPSGAITLRQFGFRFRNDDGNESAATWNAAENTNVSLAPGSKIRVRVGIDAEGDPASKDFQLEYRRKPSGGVFGDWGKVT